MANLIINAFAFKENFKSSMQLRGTMDEKKLALYMENIFVSLKSAALHNPQDDVMLVVNAPVPSPYKELFEKENIRVKEIVFDAFVLPERFVWALAFFKLCALSHVVKEEHYDNYLLLDTDTLTVSDYKEMWQEAENGVLLYPLGHTFAHHDRVRIAQDYERLYGEKKTPVHYGGEYVCGNRQALLSFVERCNAVYEKMKEGGFVVDEHTGDETILSIAAGENVLQGGESGTSVSGPQIIAATPYIYRYWTNDFYLISTNTVYNPVCIWHLPDEKKNAMRYLFAYYRKKNKFPSKEKCMRIAGIRLAKRPFNRYTLLYKIRGKFAHITEAKNA